MSTTERAFANLANLTGQPAAEKARIDEVNRGIDFTMRQVIARDARHNPNQLEPNSVVRPDGAGRDYVPGTGGFTGEGWSEPTPMVTPESRSTDEHVRRLADHFAPHAPESPLRKTGGVPLLPGHGQANLEGEEEPQK
jgi:hypothetical protein